LFSSGVALRLTLGLSRDRGSTGAPVSANQDGADAISSPDLAASPERRRRLRPNFVLGALLFVLTMAVYGRVCGFDFIILDDPTYVKFNRHVLGGLNFSGVWWAVSKFNDANWIPLTWLSLMLDATIYRNWPDGYHITNVLLHVINVLLVFSIFTRMTHSAARSAFVAALFAIHPLHVESVAWVTERKDVLCTLFGLLSLRTYVIYAEKGKRPSYVFSVVFMLLSLLAKQTFVTLPCVFLLLDYWPLARFGQPRLAEPGAETEPVAASATPPPRHTFGQLVLEKWPFFLLSAAFSVIAVIAQAGGGLRNLEGFPLQARILNAIAAYGWYAWKALVPLDLAIFYPHPAETLRAVDVIIPAAFLAAATALALVNLRRRPCLIVGWLWYLGTLFPLIGLIQIGKQGVADRYAYLPFLGLYMAVAWFIPSLVPQVRVRRILLPAAAFATIAVYAWLGYREVGLWSDDIKLFRHAMAVTNDSSMIRCAYGCALLSRGDTKGAIANLEQAVRLEPDDPIAHDDLGGAYQSAKRLDEAAREYRKSIALNDDAASPHEGLGSILSERKEYAEARKEFERALEIAPGAPLTLFNLSRLCEDLRDYDQSIAYARSGLESNPKNVDCLRQLAHVLTQQGRIDEALEAFEKVAELAPSDVDSRLQIPELRKKRHQAHAATP
jgi:tetratricopeptide (TPR) repeat protein